MGSELTHAQQRRSFQMKNLLIDVERIGDMAEDIAEFAQERVSNSVPFTPEAIQEFDELWRCAHSTYVESLQAFKTGDRAMAKHVCECEKDFDTLCWNAREMHIKRLKQGKCHPEADVIFTETLRLLERISDHADNLGVSVSRN